MKTEAIRSLAEHGTVTQDTSEMEAIFVHSELDDRNLSMAEFRLYCHLARRRGKKKAAFPGIDSISKTCQMSKPTAIAAIRSLEACHMIEVSRVPGMLTHYNLTAKSKWTPVPPKKKRTSKIKITVADQSILGNATSKNEVTKGNPLKVIQLRERDFGVFWEAYPKKEAEEDALKEWTLLKASGLLPSMDVILAAVSMLAAQTQRRKNGGRWFPDAKNWLSGHRWKDEFGQKSPAIHSKPAARPTCFTYDRKSWPLDSSGPQASDFPDASLLATVQSSFESAKRQRA